MDTARYDNLRPLTPSVCHTGPRMLHSPHFSSILHFPSQRTEALNKEGILSFSSLGSRVNSLEKHELGLGDTRVQN